MNNEAPKPDCVRGGNLGIDCAIGALTREFEIFTLRLRVFLRECKNVGEVILTRAN